MFIVFDNGVGLDAHIETLIIIVEANNIMDDHDQKHIYGMTLHGTGIDWYVKFARNEPMACIERIFCKVYQTTKLDYEIITKLSNIKKTTTQYVNEYYACLSKICDARNLSTEGDIVAICF